MRRKTNWCGRVARMGCSFIRLTNNKLIIPGKKDKIVWKENKTMKVYCNLLKEGPPLKAPKNIIWNPYVLAKVGFFY